MHEYTIEVTRDGRWWMVHIPELDGLTQARRLAEAEQMAREWIAVSTGIPIDQVSVTRRRKLIDVTVRLIAGASRRSTGSRTAGVVRPAHGLGRDGDRAGIVRVV